MVKEKFIKEKDVFLEDKTMKSGGSWGVGGTSSPSFIEGCLDYILEKNYSTIFDIGASSGQFALFPLFKEDLYVYSFEPQKEIFDLLSKNIEYNNVKTTKAFNVALSNNNGNQILKKPTDTTQTGLSTLGETPLRFNEFITEEVQIKKLDTFCIENNITNIDLIKIDTEGHEYFVLEGGIYTLQIFKPDLILEINGGNIAQCGLSVEDVHSKLDSLGYSLVKPMSDEDYLYRHKEK